MTGPVVANAGHRLREPGGSRPDTSIAL